MITLWNNAIGKDQSVMRIEDIEMDPSPPQKGEPVTVSVKTKFCKIELIRACCVY